jgi:hypothetical protein
MDHCLKAVAEMAEDPNLCEKIENVGPKSKCLMMIAGDKNTAALCEELPTGFGAYSRDECIQHVAIKNGFKGLCYLIKSNSGSTDVSPDGVSLQTCLAKAEETALDKDEGECGGRNQECCDNKCNDNLKCTVLNKCVNNCGRAEEAACFIEGCEKGTEARAGICKKCGGVNEECCLVKREKCENSMYCLTNLKCSTEPCGRDQEKPCAGKQCQGNNVYNAQLDMCLSCGYPGLSCCNNVYKDNDANQPIDVPQCFLGECQLGVCRE